MARRRGGKSGGKTTIRSTFTPAFGMKGYAKAKRTGGKRSSGKSRY
jgi:hypothetical protein